ASGNSAPAQTTARRPRPLVNGPRTDQPPDPRNPDPDKPPAPRPPTENELPLPERQPEPHPPAHLTVLGPIRLTHHQHDSADPTDLTPAVAPKHRELLTYLTLHRHGVRCETLATALWPDAPPDHPYNAFHATHSQLRRALRTATHDTLTDLTTLTDGRYSLDHTQITVDLWHLQDTLQTTHHTDDEQTHRAALQRGIALYTGNFAADLTAEWTESPREALRRDVLDTVSTLVRLLRTDDPEQALVLLEHTRTLDPYNEAVYRDIMRFQHHLGHHDAISRTLALLTTALAELGDEPSTETVDMCRALQRSRSSGRSTGGRTSR
ncbi:MAG TPA: bacterial transcriptional activator domain-containing protein, partial [Streptomyces sp.]